MDTLLLHYAQGEDFAVYLFDSVEKAWYKNAEVPKGIY